MHPLTSAELLQAWESALDLPNLQRELALLGPACPEYNGQALAALPLGRRDNLLLTLREWTFGPRLTALTDCPGCAARVELEFTTSEIRVPQLEEISASYELEVDGMRMRFRLPDSLDLAAVSANQTQPGRRSLLLERCLLAAENAGQPIPLGELPEVVIQAIVTEMARLDGQADVRLSLACPACDKKWSELFDIGAFFWSEIQRWALRLLAEVHSLASVYGWSEASILAMSPRRRQLYLQMMVNR